MSTLIKIKRSEVSGNPAVLGAGELAYSALADNGSNGGDRLYIGTGTETNGNAVNHVVIGGKYFTDMVSAATSSNSTDTLVKRDFNGNFTAGIITAALNGNAATAYKWYTARNLDLTGDATATLSVDGSANVSAAITFASVNSNSGTFGGNGSIPVITVNEKGLITAVSTAAISTTLNIAGSTGSGSVGVGTGTLTIAGGTGVQSSYSDTTKTITLNIGQSVGTTDDVTFNNVTVNGSLNSDDITAANISVAGNAVITGNLTVQGTTTTINSNTLAVGDANIVLAKDANSAAAANGAGLTVNGPTVAATLTYTSADDRWNLNKDLTVSTVYGNLIGNASTATSLVTARDLSLTGDATATLSSFNGSANVTAAITLATVNANVGSYGSGTEVPVVTVNGKGLVTGVSTTNIPTASTTVTGLAKFDSTQFNVTAGLVSLVTFDGGTF